MWRWVVLLKQQQQQQTRTNSKRCTSTDPIRHLVTNYWVREGRGKKKVAAWWGTNSAGHKIGMLATPHTFLQLHRYNFHTHARPTLNKQRVAVNHKGGKGRLTQIREEEEGWHKPEKKKKMRIRRKRRTRRKSSRLTDLVTAHYSLCSLLPSSDSSPSQHTASSCGPGFVLRPRLPGVRLGFAEGEAARRRGDRGLQGADPRGRGRGGGVTRGSDRRVLVMVQQVLVFRRPGGRRGRADGTQIGSVGGGESGRALEQLPLPLLGNLSWEEGRRIALQPGWHHFRLARYGRRGKRSVRPLWRQLVGGWLKLWALGWRQQAVVGQAAIPRRLISQALVAGVRGAFGLERGQGVMCRVRRAQAGGAGAPGGQNQRGRVGGVGAPSQGVAWHAPWQPRSSPTRSSGALAPLSPSPSHSARAYTAPHHCGSVQAARLGAVTGLVTGVEDGGRRGVETLSADHLRREEEKTDQRYEGGVGGGLRRKMKITMLPKE